MPTVQFNLNGRPTEASYEPGMHFLEVLREECGVVSTKDGCAPEGTCGCCLVLVDGHPALSCLRKPEQMAGHRYAASIEGSVQGVEVDIHSTHEEVLHGRQHLSPFAGVGPQ